MDKRQLRKNIISFRNELNAWEINKASDEICRQLLSLPDFLSHDSYMVYKSFKGEVDTTKLIRSLSDCEKTVLYPVTDGDNMQAVKPTSDQFVNGDFGVEIPRFYQVWDKPDVVITPLVACDLSKNRMGFGKGFYDRYFYNHDCLKIGICYDFQVCDLLPTDDWDVPLDVIVTEKRILT